MLLDSDHGKTLAAISDFFEQKYKPEVVFASNVKLRIFKVQM